MALSFRKLLLALSILASCACDSSADAEPVYEHYQDAIAPHAPTKLRPRCDMLNPIPIRRGRPFVFDSFPPPPGSSHSHSYKMVTPSVYSYSSIPPEECTWVFEAAGNCTLKFRSYSYQRGDVDCREEYFLIGDETTEQRFCGFLPPKYFLSGGKQLFLTHYQKNGYRETRRSYIDGEIRCVKSQQPPPVVCPPTPPTNCTVFKNFTVGQGHLGTIGEPLSSPVADQKCSVSEGCVMFGVACVTLNEISQECNVTGNPTPKQDAGTCESTVLSCGVPNTDCPINLAEMIDNDLAQLKDLRQISCTATPQQPPFNKTCLIGVFMCTH